MSTRRASDGYVSTGHPDVTAGTTAGTIGARVKDAVGNVYALSNNHVYARENLAIIGDAVIQPGTFDGGISPDDDIGTLFAFEIIEFKSGEFFIPNEMDAAIVLSSTADLGKATPSDGYGTPKSTTIAASIGQKVMKYGRKTGLTKGRITAINGTFLVGYDSGDALFFDQIAISSRNFTKAGDSGALIVINGKGKNKPDDRKPVGLHFAGNGTNLSISNPIDAVLLKLGELVGSVLTIDGE